MISMICCRPLLVPATGSYHISNLCRLHDLNGLEVGEQINLKVKTCQKHPNDPIKRRAGQLTAAGQL